MGLTYLASLGDRLPPNTAQLGEYPKGTMGCLDNLRTFQKTILLSVDKHRLLRAGGTNSVLPPIRQLPIPHLYIL